MHDLLEPDRILEAACVATGLDDLGEPSWREGLERLAAALHTEAGLNEVGRMVAAVDLQSHLERRLRITARRIAAPAAAPPAITAPIVIVGQARTGTTILYDLLAQDPALRAPRSWEVAHPDPPPHPKTADGDPRIAATDAELAAVDAVIPEFRRMHAMGATLGQECVAITGGDLRSMMFPTQYRVPTYARWLLDEADMAPAYRWHRRFLEHLASGYTPLAPRWVLKSPGHIWCLEALLAEYPDALLVQTHRDPLRIVASITSLVAVLRRLASDDPDPHDIAREFADHIAAGLDRSVGRRRDGTVAAERVYDLQFADFLADPMATVSAIYDHFGLDLTLEAERRMRAFLAAQPADAHGGHRYSFSDTGLEAAALRERCAEYVSWFGVRAEPVT